MYICIHQNNTYNNTTWRYNLKLQQKQPIKTYTIIQDGDII